jgi:hypothetical protein
LVPTSNIWDSSASAIKSSLKGGSLQTAPFLHSLPYRTDLVAPVVFLITPGHGPRRHRSSVTCVSTAARTCLRSRFLAADVSSCLLRIFCLETDVVPLCFAAVA